MAEIEHRAPTVDEFRDLAASISWTDHFDWATVGDALAASLHSVVAVEGAQAVGVARVVGDGVRYFYLQDVMVHPDHADGGIATDLTRALLDWIDGASAPKAFIGLFASPDAEGVYEGFGFTTDDMTGMHRLIG